MLVAGCAHEPKPQPKPEAVDASPAPANTTPPERQHYILELLEAGKRDQARTEAQQLLKEQPDNAEAATLLNEIDADPQVLLGEKNFSYTIQAGDTLPTLADKYLGDSNLFYALARYNNIEVPNDAAPGTVILMPTTRHEAHPGASQSADRPAEPAERPTHVERAEHRDQAPPVLRKRQEPAPEARKPPVLPEAPPPTPAAPSAASHDPARASRLRSEALVELNKGEINPAVSLLREASRLDPDSQPISADLARALRIQSATHR